MSLPYRRSVRFNKSHYNRGFYFVTICTRDRIHRFGDIVDGIMHLYELGEFVTQVLQTIREHNRYAECTLFVVMPNHIHAIFAIDLKNVPTAHFVGARHASPAIIPWRVLFALRAIILWHDVNIKNTPMAYLTGEACLAPTKPCRGKANMKQTNIIFEQIEKNNVVAI